MYLKIRIWISSNVNDRIIRKAVEWYSLVKARIIGANVQRNNDRPPYWIWPCVISLAFMQTWRTPEKSESPSVPRAQNCAPKHWFPGLMSGQRSECYWEGGGRGILCSVRFKSKHIIFAGSLKPRSQTVARAFKLLRPVNNIYFL